MLNWLKAGFYTIKGIIIGIITVFTLLMTACGILWIRDKYDAFEKVIDGD